jgi:hypothetical protein
LYCCLYPDTCTNVLTNNFNQSALSSEHDNDNNSLVTYELASLGDMSLRSDESARSGLPGDPEYDQCLKIEKQRRSTENNWRQRSQTRRKWLSRIEHQIKKKEKGKNKSSVEFDIEPGQASLLEASTTSVLKSPVQYGSAAYDAQAAAGGMYRDSIFPGGHDSMWSDKSVPSKTSSKRDRRKGSGYSQSKSYNDVKHNEPKYTASMTVQNGLPQAHTVLRHQNLRAVKHIPRISKRQLVDAMMKHNEPIMEFHRQVSYMRELMMPYVLHGTETYEDAKKIGKKYGTYDTTQRPLGATYRGATAQY